MTHATPDITSTAPSSLHLATLIRTRGLGTAGSWARDFGLIGLVSGVLGPLLGGQGHLPMAYVLACGLAGAILGLGVGCLLRWLLREVVTDVPLLVLFATLGPVVGLFWGASVGAIGGLFLGTHFVSLSVFFATVSAIAQLGWIWLPYALLRGQLRATWPLITLAAITPLVGAAFLQVGGY